MKFLSSIFIFILFSLLLGCGSGSEINGRNLKTANQSVSMIKDRLSVEKRIEFEVSYWTVRDLKKNNRAFLATVDGKNADAIIIMGKEIFQQRKNDGFPKYEKYSNWDHMIAEYVQERLDQNKPRSQSQFNRDQANNVLYNL